MDHSGDLSRAIADLGEQVRQVEQALSDLRHHSECLDWVAAEAVSPAALLARQLFEQGIAEAEHSIRTALDRCRPFVEHDVPIVSLASTSVRWLDEVERPISRLVQPMGDPNHVADWSGTAREAYRYRKNLQLQALTVSVSRVQFVGHWLDDVVVKIALPMVKELINQLSKLVDAVVSMAAKIFSAPIPGVGEVEGAFAINDFLNLTGTYVGAVMQVFATYLGLLAVEIQLLHDATAQLDDESVFLGRRWPLAAHR